MRMFPADASTAQARHDSLTVPAEVRAGIAVAHHPVGPDTARNGAGTVERCRPDQAVANTTETGVIGSSIEATSGVTASTGTFTPASSNGGGITDLIDTRKRRWWGCRYLASLRVSELRANRACTDRN